MQKQLCLRLSPINTALPDSNEQKSILVNDLSFVACGLEHVVYENTSQQAEREVIIFKRYKNNNDPVMLYLMGMFDEVYEQVMASMFNHVCNYRWPKQPMQIENDNMDQLESIYSILEKEALLHSFFDEIPNQMEFKLDHKFSKVWISRNIRNINKFNTIVEFKPKSVLPDVYSPSIVTKVSHTLQISEDKVKEIIGDSQPIEKLRWYKKSKTKQHKKNIKLNENPLNIFNVIPKGDKSHNVDLTATKAFKYLPNLTQSQLKHLNTSILQLLHDSPHLLQDIYLIQSLYHESPENISEEAIKQLEFSFLNTRILEEQIKKRMKEKLKKKDIVHLNKFYEFLRCFTCMQVEQQKQEYSEISVISQLFLFLLSMTYRDISIVYRANFDGVNFIEQELYIIDDYLKDYTIVRTNLQKDEKFLTKYLESKLNIKSTDNFQQLPL